METYVLVFLVLTLKSYLLSGKNIFFKTNLSVLNIVRKVLQTGKFKVWKIDVLTCWNVLTFIKLCTVSQTIRDWKKNTKKFARESHTDPKKQRKRKKLCPVPYGTRAKYSKNITSFYLFFLFGKFTLIVFSNWAWNYQCHQSFLFILVHYSTIVQWEFWPTSFLWNSCLKIAVSRFYVNITG